MSFKVKPFKEVLKYTKEKLDEALAPIRAKLAKARANLEVGKIEERMVSLETEIHTLCAEKELDFKKITDKMDEFELLERRHKQIEQLVAELFPEGGGDGANNK